MMCQKLGTNTHIKPLLYVHRWRATGPTYSTARQYLVCNPVTQQIKPMTFNPIMGCVFHSLARSSDGQDIKQSNWGRQKQIAAKFFIMYVYRWAGYNELSPANTWNPLLRCPNDKQRKNSGEQGLFGGRERERESRVETQLTSDTGGQGWSARCDCVCQTVLCQAIYWSALRLCHLHCALFWTRVGSIVTVVSLATDLVTGQ